MDYRDQNLVKSITKKNYMTAYVLPMLFLLFTGTFAFQGDLLGSTSTAPEQEIVQEDTLTSTDAETASDSMVMDSLEMRAFITEALENPQKIQPLPPTMVDEETLWLARCIFSETKRPEEQELVAWVVRNRVQTGFRGKKSYKSAVLAPYQFSAFNPNSRKRTYYSKLGVESDVAGWKRAVSIAHAVRNAPEELRPFPEKTRHFYSERSMVGVKHPDWAQGLKPVVPKRKYKLDAKRFRFFEGVS